MLISLCYVVLRHVLRLAVLGCRSHDFKELEHRRAAARTRHPPSADEAAGDHDGRPAVLGGGEPAPAPRTLAHSSSRRPRCCVGIGTWSLNDGRHHVVRAGRESVATFGSWSCGSREKTPAMEVGTAAAREPHGPSRSRCVTFRPGHSRWNKIEHRVCSHIAMNWRGTTLVDLATIVSLIGSTHRRSGLHVRSELDRGTPRWRQGYRRATRDDPPGTPSLSTATGTIQFTLRRGSQTSQLLSDSPLAIRHAHVAEFVGKTRAA